jgi:hypothetical protein
MRFSCPPPLISSTIFIHFINIGAGESGKSTFAKQMRLLHMKGFSSLSSSPSPVKLDLFTFNVPLIVYVGYSESMLKDWKLLVQANVVTATQFLIKIAAASKKPFDSSLAVLSSSFSSNLLQYSILILNFPPLYVLKLIKTLGRRGVPADDGGDRGERRARDPQAHAAPRRRRNVEITFKESQDEIRHARLIAIVRISSFTPLSPR